MNLPRPKKYIVLTLVLVSLFLANDTWAQLNLAPADLATTSASTLTTESVIPVESSSTTEVIPQAKPKGRANVNNEQRTALPQIRQTRITNLAANISNRMDAAVMRLSTISQRLEQRIIKMEELGIETSLAREKLASANETLTNARLKLSDIDTLVNGATYSTLPRSDWMNVKEYYQETNSLIRQAHFALRESIMALQNPAPKNMTPDPSINPTEPELIFN